MQAKLIKIGMVCMFYGTIRRDPANCEFIPAWNGVGWALVQVLLLSLGVVQQIT